MEPNASQPRNDDDKDQPAHALQRAKSDLEDQIERAVATHEPPTGDSIEVSLNFEEEDLPEGEDNEAGPELMERITGLVDDFHSSPAVTGKGVRIRRLTAIDSDADGEVAVRVHYDHAGYE